MRLFPPFPLVERREGESMSEGPEKKRVGQGWLRSIRLARMDWRGSPAALRAVSGRRLGLSGATWLEAFPVMARGSPMMESVPKLHRRST